MNEREKQLEAQNRALIEALAKPHELNTSPSIVVSDPSGLIAAQAARIQELEGRFEDVIANLEDLRNRPGDMMILGTALSIARNYKKVRS